MVSSANQIGNGFWSDRLQFSESGRISTGLIRHQPQHWLKPCFAVCRLSFGTASAGLTFNDRHHYYVTLFFIIPCESTKGALQLHPLLLLNLTDFQNTFTVQFSIYFPHNTFTAFTATLRRCKLTL